VFVVAVAVPPLLQYYLIRSPAVPILPIPINFSKRTVIELSRRARMSTREYAFEEPIKVLIIMILDAGGTARQ
jgi:hypothetical protein